MRIGPRYAFSYKPLILSGQPLRYVSTFKYLGIHILAGRKFNTDFTGTRPSFYRAFNAIYYRYHGLNSEVVCLQLLNSISVPVLLYALEAGLPTRSTLSMLNG